MSKMEVANTWDTIGSKKILSLILVREEMVSNLEAAFMNHPLLGQNTLINTSLNFTYSSTNFLNTNWLLSYPMANVKMVREL